MVQSIYINAKNFSNILFDKDMLYVDNAHKDTTIYDYDFNIIGHEYVDDNLKT